RAHQLRVLGEQLGQLQLRQAILVQATQLCRRLIAKPRFQHFALGPQGYAHDVPSWKVAEAGAQQVALEPPNHDLLQRLRAGLDRNAAREPLWIEQLEKSREGVGMPVVRGGRKKKSILEERCDLPNQLGQIG